jgi:hypothetical protein
MDKRGKRDSLTTHEIGDILCEQCGKIIRYDNWSRNKFRKRPEWEKCSDCKAKPVYRVSYRHKVLGLITCQPWQFETDADLNPVRDGKLFRPGVRICGHKDCVVVGHILPPHPEDMQVQDV